MVVENHHLLKAITRIIPHQSGSVLLDGKDISKEDTKALAKNGHTGTSDYKYIWSTPCPDGSCTGGWVLREVFQIDAVIGRDPGTNKPMCVTYNLLRGENEHEETINPVFAIANSYY